MSQLNSDARDALLSLSRVIDQYNKLEDEEKKRFRHILYQQTGKFGKWLMKEEVYTTIQAITDDLK